jgi:hypothetical protein
MRLKRYRSFNRFLKRIDAYKHPFLSRVEKNNLFNILFQKIIKRL